MKPTMSRKDRIKNVYRVATGNFLEMYDFMVYGYYASYIAKTFFPAGNEFTSLMLSLATFGAGYLMRPLGALFLGSYIDRQGRRKGLVMTLAMMAFGTLTISCTPGYSSIGVLAPILVVLGRLIQGLSAGVELGGVSVYLSEIATPGNKGFYCAWQSASQQVAVVMAAAIGMYISSILPPAEMLSYGWRIPMWIGCIIIPLIFIIRRGLKESPEFEARHHHPSNKEVLRTVAENWQKVGLGTMMSVMTTTTFYLITAYIPTFGKHALHLSPSDSLLATFCVGISNFIWLPIGGAISDRIGRRPLLFLCTILTLCFSYPAMSWLVTAPSFSRLLAVVSFLSFIFGVYNGSMIPFLTEIMPAKVRTTAFSLSFSLATAIFGGFTPAVCTYLIEKTGNRASPALWLSAAALIGLAAVSRLASSSSPEEVPLKESMTASNLEFSGND
ncbi:MFS transporter [Geomonas azotofigens]|uniref:MFS transporter n=1 Tax=Geomonas azotofigens TaxID=2843196 RepID=UPI001C120E70|nr:MFS transporter [Geomonas azotofigens]MBU5615285.1 MFS transporter [Geomonas azotofigens]